MNENTQSTLSGIVPMKFHDTIDIARSHANREAADTGGTVLEVRSIEIDHENLLFIGPILAVAITTEVCFPVERPTMKGRSLGNFHTASADGLGQPGPLIGFLVLHHPLTLQLQRAGRSSDEVWVAVDLKHRDQSLPPGLIGLHCCRNCNEPISKLRLAAVPGARLCTKCQSKKEEMKSWIRQTWN